MRGKLLALAGLGLSLLSTGCCMCANPYDYCGPTFRGGPCECCDENCRMNSVFDPCHVAHGDYYAEGSVETIEGAPVPTEAAPAEHNEPADEGAKPASVMQRVEQASYERPAKLRR